MDKGRKTIKELLQQYKETGVLPWKAGRRIEQNEVVITPDQQYNQYLNTLPNNQRLSPETEYRQHRYWELNDKPKDFDEAVDRGMFTYEDDGLWHANSVAENKNTGEIELMKPNHHPTRYMEEMEYWKNKDFNSRYKVQRGLVYDKYIPHYDGTLLPSTIAAPLIWKTYTEK